MGPFSFKSSLLGPELRRGQPPFLPGLRTISPQNEVSISPKQGGVPLNHRQLRLGNALQELLFLCQWSVTGAKQSGSCRAHAELPIR